MCDCSDGPANICKHTGVNGICRCACHEGKAEPGLVIRFDGPPSHESGRFVETELDGKGVKLGEWKQQGDDWLLVLPEAMAEIVRKGDVQDILRRTLAAIELHKVDPDAGDSALADVHERIVKLAP